GTVTQERDGTCTGPNNSIVYTIWSTTDDTCQAAPAAPVSQTTTDPGDNCATTTFTQALACPAGELGQITQTRTLDGCTGAYTPWVTPTGGNSCSSPATATCVPQTQETTLACPPGQTGSIRQSRSSTCS